MNKNQNNTPILLAKENILPHLREQVELTILQQIGSTNDYLKTSKRNKKVQICLAEEQTQGRGRLDRKWYSPYAENIYLSCLFPFAREINELAGLSLVVSLSIQSVLKKYLPEAELYVKWPNDVICDEKKIAGCLVETESDGKSSLALIGIGMNANMTESLTVTTPWTSVLASSGVPVDRNEVVVALLNSLFAYFSRFNAQGFVAFIDEWQKEHYLANKTIFLQLEDSKVQGNVVGIDNQGRLLLELASGEIKAFSAGDASVCK